MAEAMIRKQVYLGRKQDQKLKALAKQRACTEAEIIREALDALPEPEEDVLIAGLEADGIIARRWHDPALPQGEAARRLLDEYEQWLDSYTRDVQISEAILDDRGPR